MRLILLSAFNDAIFNCAFSFFVALNMGYCLLVVIESFPQNAMNIIEPKFLLNLEGLHR